MSQITITLQTATIDTSKYVLSDDPSTKRVTVTFAGLFVPVVIWDGDAYTAAGDYTQVQVDARITEVLGADPAAKISSLLRHL
jgi:hypothetical protein